MERFAQAGIPFQYYRVSTPQRKNGPMEPQPTLIPDVPIEVSTPQRKNGPMEHAPNTFTVVDPDVSTPQRKNGPMEHEDSYPHLHRIFCFNSSKEKRPHGTAGVMVPKMFAKCFNSSKEKRPHGTNYASYTVVTEIEFQLLKGKTAPWN